MPHLRQRQHVPLHQDAPCCGWRGDLGILCHRNTTQRLAELRLGTACDMTRPRQPSETPSPISDATTQRMGILTTLSCACSIHAIVIRPWCAVSCMRCHYICAAKTPGLRWLCGLPVRDSEPGAAVGLRKACAVEYAPPPPLWQLPAQRGWL